MAPNQGVYAQVCLGNAATAEGYVGSVACVGSRCLAGTLTGAHPACPGG